MMTISYIIYTVDEETVTTQDLTTSAMITQDLAVQDPSDNTRSAREHKIHQTAQGLVSLDPSINAIIKPVCIQDDTNEKERCPSS